MYDTATPFLSSYVILRKKDKIGFVLRSNTSWMDNHYSLPAGKVEKKETFTQAAVREALEEVGVTVRPDDLVCVHVMHRASNDDITDWVDVFYEVRRFEGEPYNAEPGVHGEFKWLDPHRLPENVVPNVKFAIEQIEDGNFFSEFGWN